MDIMDKIVSLAKRRGFIYPGSAIYGGLSGTWDYGPLGVELKNNIKRQWWRAMVQARDDIYGLDAAILMNPRVWQASGHVEGFADQMVDCKNCQKRFRIDQLESGKSRAGHDHNIDEKQKKCPECGGELTAPRPFNLMLKTFIGPVENEAAQTYLRPETAQGIFVNFANVISSFHPKLPFGIAQIGKAFRNEITPRNFTFRSREFEQMELEFFTEPQDDRQWFELWRKERLNWYLSLGLNADRVQLRDQNNEELAHYAKAACDIEYNFPFGWSELEGIANRADFDLRQHSQYSGEDLKFIDSDGKKFFPYIIEPSGGVDRAAAAFLIDAYHEEEDRDGTRTILALHPRLAPYKAAVFPLVANKPQLVDKAQELYRLLKDRFMVAWDDIGNIGKRYRRQDEIGTPWCVTVDYQTLEDDTVTVRDRDSMEQTRISIKELNLYFSENI